MIPKIIWDIHSSSSDFETLFLMVPNHQNNVGSNNLHTKVTS